MKSVDRQIKKQINTQVKLHFEKNYKNKVFYQKSHLIAKRCLFGQFHVRLYFFSILEKQSKNTLKDTIRDLKWLGSENDLKHG